MLFRSAAARDRAARTSASRRMRGRGGGSGEEITEGDRGGIVWPQDAEWTCARMSSGISSRWVASEARCRAWYCSRSRKQSQSQPERPWSPEPSPAYRPPVPRTQPGKHELNAPRGCPGRSPRPAAHLGIRPSLPRAPAGDPRRSCSRAVSRTYAARQGEDELTLHE